MKNELEKYLESRFRLNTIRGIINEIKLYKNWCEKENVQIEAANYNDILAYINYCREKRNSKRTIYSKLNCIKHYYDYLQINQAIPTNPVIDIKLRNIEKNTDQLFISTGKTGIKNPLNIFSGIKKLLINLKKTEPKIKDAKQIRASVINHWLKQYNIRQVQYMIGHKYISSTERYSTNKLETLQEQIELLHPLK